LFLDGSPLIIELIRYNFKFFLELNQINFSCSEFFLLNFQLFHCFIETDVWLGHIDLLSFIYFLQLSHLLKQKLVLFE